MTQYYGLTDGKSFHMKHGPCFAYTSTSSFIEWGESLGVKFIYPVGGYVNLDRSELATAMMDIPYFKSAILSVKRTEDISSELSYKVPGHLVTFDPYRQINQIKNVMHWLRQPTYPQWGFAELMYHTGIPAEVCIFFAHQIAERYRPPQLDESGEESLIHREYSVSRYWSGSLDNSVRIPQIVHWLQEQRGEEIPESDDNFFKRRCFPVGNDTVNRSMFTHGRSGPSFNKLFSGKSGGSKDTIDLLINPILEMLNV